MHSPRPIYSGPSRTNATRREIEPEAISPSKPRYIRDPNGALKYVIDVNLNGIPKPQISVNAQKNVLFIASVYERISDSGDRCTHEVYREIHLPANVHSDRIRCVYSEPKVLTILADADEPQYLLSSHATKRENRNVLPRQTPWRNRPTSPPAAQKPAASIDPRRVTFAEPVRLHSITEQPCTWIPSNVPINAVQSSDNTRLRMQSPEPTYSARARRLPTQTLCQTNSLERLYQRSLNPPSAKAVCNNVAQSSKRYTLRVDIGSHITPADLQILRHNGILTIHAKRQIRGNLLDTNNKYERLLFEYRSEHTLPNDVHLDAMTARLDNGILYIDAPYIRPNPGSIMSPAAVKLRQFNKR